MSLDASPMAAVGRGSLMQRARAALFVLLAWLAFAAVELIVSAALDHDAATVWSREILVDLTMAVYWSAITVPIAAWHRRVRASGRGVGGMLVLHFPLLVLATIGDTMVTRSSLHYFAGVTPAAPFIATLTFFADFDTLCYLGVIVVVDGLIARDAALAGERRTARLEALLGRARLEYLEAQLQPHFLFNALGAVSELAYEAPAAALRVLRQLALIFRTALNARSGEVTLGEELVAIEPYLDIQRLRFPDWLRIDYDVGGDTLDCLVPRFVLQPLVENAIRHGLTGRIAAGCIEISSKLVDGRLVLRVADNGVGLRQVGSRSGYGIGLTNVRDRLTTLYGPGDQLRLVDAEGGGAVAEVALPARRSVDAPATPNVVPLPDDLTESPDGKDTGDSLHPVVPYDRLRRAASLTGIWITCGLLWTIQSYAYLRIRNRLGDYTLFGLTVHDVSAALLWAGIAPIAFAATARFPLTRARLALRLPLYLLGTAAIAIVHAAVLIRVFTPKLALWSSANANTFVLNVLIVAVLECIGHRRQLIEWMRERERAAAALSAELRTARQRATRMQAIPPVVLRALDRVIDAVNAEPSPRRTEQLTTRLGDYLRVAIECSDEGDVTAEREQSLARSLAHLERLAGPPIPGSVPSSPSTLTRL
ncbi:MAG TPA: histidine kinase [Gemmatimonadaceae bacterium]